MKVEGIDYSPEGVASLREDLIKLRDSQYNHWPESIDITLILTYTIAILQEYIDDKSN